MLARIDSYELTEWEAYEQVTGPLGPERWDHLFAMLQATIANTQRSKRTKPFKPDQFLPEWGVAQEKAPQTGDEMLRAIKKLNTRLGGNTRGDPG